MSLAGVLLVLFVVLKLVGVIAWSWVWVLSPLWIGFALWVIYFLVIIVIGSLFGSKF